MSAVALPIPDDVPILDLAYLEELDADGGEELVRELAEAFTTDTALRLPRLVEAVRSGDAATVRAQAHAIKGSSASFGARRVSLCAAALEHVPAVDAVCPDQLAQLRAEFDEVLALCQVRWG